ncbi:uncharacterized protein LODBEIA_P27290 [Lodderomyces beijingensis]|uniref:Phospholipid/glycerol acyltransferase domain-containing protein n=1 Tax=Lodderomyces beijingensis TaxID=1775926 RepID=A0ABP0ZQM2_9ASCO
MEKFSTWRDKGTGISPFMPQQFPIYQKNRGNLLNRVVLILVRIPILIVKLPLFIIASVLYSITGLQFLLNFIFIFLFGFNPVEFSVDGVKKSQVQQLQPFTPRKNDIIVTNYTSPLDGYFMSLLAHSSNIVILVPDPSGILYKYNPWSLVNHAFGQVRGEAVQDLSKLHNKIVFLLLEGTTSNNTAILPFIKLDPKYDFKEFRCKSLVMRLYPQYFTLPVANISSSYYLFELLTDFTRKNVRCKIYDFGASEQLHLARIRKSFELGSLSSVELSIDAKQRFISYYFQSHDVRK